MNTLSSKVRQYRWECVLGLALAVVAAWQLARSAGLYPAIFADEMLYSAYARLTPLAEAAIPSYLYLGLYGYTSAFGAAFLDGARLFNTTFLVGAAPFLYLLARRYVDRPLAVLVALLSVAAPFNCFTAYFMPETMYFFAFCVFSWATLRETGSHWAAHALLTGALLGLMTMVKVHALFLVPALVLFHVWRNWTEAPLAARAAAAGLLAGAAALAVKFGLGYAFGGRNGLHLFGSFYGLLVHDTARHALLPMLAPGWVSLRGHVMALAVAFGVPMAMLALALASRKARAQAGVALTNLHAYTILMLGAVVAMTVAYTASIASYGPQEGLRLHQRYYDFAFPLLYLVAAAGIRQARPGAARRLAWAVAACIGAAALLALVKLPTYELVMIDTPEIASLFRHRVFALLAGAAGVLALVLWARGAQGGARLYLFLLAPLLAAQGAIEVVRYQVPMRTPSSFDLAGQYARAHVPAAERDDIMVAGTKLGDLMRTKYHIDARGPALFEMAEGAPFDINYLPVRKKWLLVVGPHALPPALKPVARTEDFALVRIGPVHRPIGAEAFSGEPGESLIAGVAGLSWVEWWGRWSDAKEVQVRFHRKLPAHMSVVLTAQAFGPNAGQEFIARVGTAERRFRLGGASAELFLTFETDGQQDTLHITVPQPTAPSAATSPGDHRTLGIGLHQLELGTTTGELP